MDPARFGGSPVGKLVPIKGVHRGQEFALSAFVPDPLPAELVLESETWERLAEAVAAIARLDGAGRRLPNPHLIARPAIRREAVSTSALEGTYTTLPEVLQSELFEEEVHPSREATEVLAYVRAAEYAFEAIRTRPLSLNLIREIHRILMENDPDCADHEKGEFRDRQNFIGPRDAPVEQALFVPPPPKELKELLSQWERWVHREEINALIRMGIGHYQFEALHPFIDGNGRMGRLIALLTLLEDGLLSVPLLNISPYLESRRAEYQELLREASATGDFDGWLRFFIMGTRQAAEEALDKTEHLVELRDRMVADLRARRIRGTAIQIAEDLVGQPIVTPSRLARTYHVTYQAVAYAIDRLVEAGILSPLDNRHGRRTYAALQVLSLLQS